MLPGTNTGIFRGSPPKRDQCQPSPPRTPSPRSTPQPPPKAQSPVTGDRERTETEAVFARIDANFREYLAGFSKQILGELSQVRRSVEDLGDRVTQVSRSVGSLDDRVTWVSRSVGGPIELTCCQMEPAGVKL